MRSCWLSIRYARRFLGEPTDLSELVSLGQERVDDPGIELLACLFPDILAGPGLAPRGAVGTTCGQRIPGVDHRENSSRERNLLALELPGIPSAVPPLVMAIGDVQRRPKIRDRREELVRPGEMAHHVELSRP